jgi:cytochrome c553
MPRSALGDFQTTIFIIPSNLMPTAETAAGDEQKSHQKQQRSRGENGCDQDTCAQCHGKNPQKKRGISAMMHLPRLLSVPIYADRRQMVQKVPEKSIKIPLTTKT